MASRGCALSRMGDYQSSMSLNVARLALLHLCILLIRLLHMFIIHLLAWILALLVDFGTLNILDRRDLQSLVSFGLHACACQQHLEDEAD